MAYGRSGGNQLAGMKMEPALQRSTACCRSYTGLAADEASFIAAFSGRNEAARRLELPDQLVGT